MKRINVEGIVKSALWGSDEHGHLDASEAMTASEQMFFRGSPLAHIVRYEQELQRYRRRHFHHIAQARRFHDQW
jgi:hypothetical protein